MRAGWCCGCEAVVSAGQPALLCVRCLAAALHELVPPPDCGPLAVRCSGVTIEYQRQQAKAMRQYFQSLKLNETVEKSK